MSTFCENNWEADEIGDKLNKQLFKKIHKKSLKKTRNSKLNSSKVKRTGIKKEKLASINVNTLSHNPVEITTADNSKKRQNINLNVNNNCDSVKKFKFSPKHINNNKNKINNDLINTGIKKLKSDGKHVVANKKNVVSKHNLVENDVVSKSRKKKKKNVFKERNDDSQYTKEKIKIKKIQEMLMKKKSENEKCLNKSESLRDRMMTQLRASRFRYLNETLYNNQSFESRKMFKDDPDAFKAYHTGYRQQVEQWPLNPLDVIITAVKKMPKDYIIADFGCGEARLAESVEQKVHSLDLVAVNDNVVACDMAHTPLLTSGIHVVVFCLSLMGSNLSDYLLEANRVLKKDGILKIADIESRFENVDEFITSLSSYGFKNTWKDLSHNLFYFMDFKKTGDIDRRNKKLPLISLKSCLYKKR